MPLGKAPAALVMVTSPSAVTSSAILLAGLTGGLTRPPAVNEEMGGRGAELPANGCPAWGGGGAKMVPVSATATT
jgi:hypothetical protein